jgi:hypothetical protein
MGRLIAFAASLGALLLALGATTAGAASVNVGINVGVPVPPPPVIVASPPQLVVVPGSPVYYAPRVEQNYFVYARRPYTFHDGHWFVASAPGQPWTLIATERVPPPVLAVPVAYYKVPPGHAKKLHGGPHGKPGKHKD